MKYKYAVGDIVVLKETPELGDARVAGFRYGKYVLEFAIEAAVSSELLQVIRFPHSGGREFLGLYAAEEDIAPMELRSNS